MNMALYKSSNLYEATALSILLETPPQYIRENSIILFGFDINENLWRALNSYAGGVEMNIFVYVQALKRIKGEMFSRRNSK
jgi:hypothetical protein